MLRGWGGRRWVEAAGDRSWGEAARGGSGEATCVGTLAARGGGEQVCDGGAGCGKT